MVDPSTYPSPAHAIEPAILLFAVAAQASGRLGVALALAVLAVFVKPGMGYLLGAALVAESLATASAGPRWRRFVPAAVLGAALSVALIAAFGWEPLANTMIPTESRKLYQDQNCGFFHGDGQVFWKPPPVRPVLYYIFTPAGGWLLASGVLAAGGLVATIRWHQDAAARVAMLVAGLHLTFVLFLFGNRYAWSYYPWMPCLGAAVVLDRLPRWTAVRGVASVAWAFVVALGLLAVAHTTFHTFRLRSVWQAVERDPRIDGFYASPQVATAWQQVRERADDGGVFVLSRAGCAWYFAAGVESPSVWYLNRAVATPGEWERVRAGIARNRWLLVPDWFDSNLLTWPELADVLAPFRPAGQGPGVAWYRRAVSPPP